MSETTKDAGRLRSADASFLTPEFIAKVRRVVSAKAFGLDSDDHEDITQRVLIDVWESKSYLADSANEGALVQHIRFRCLEAIRYAKRHSVRGELFGGRIVSTDVTQKEEPYA